MVGRTATAPFDPSTIHDRARKHGSGEPHAGHAARSSTQLRLHAHRGRGRATDDHGTHRHSSITITYDLYGHLLPGAHDRTGQQLQAYIDAASTPVGRGGILTDAGWQSSGMQAVCQPRSRNTSGVSVGTLRHTSAVVPEAPLRTTRNGLAADGEWMLCCETLASRGGAMRGHWKIFEGRHGSHNSGSTSTCSNRAKYSGDVPPRERAGGVPRTRR